MGFRVLPPKNQTYNSGGFECVNQWQAHSGIVLSSTIGGKRLITGGNDCYVAVWDISACIPSEPQEESGNTTKHIGLT
jgi:hypothetical protein